ncbi:hypothetical protein SteCoe_37601 [Stentor coeruleus]|uniref:MARVEL domain-containing protein n=1 Tax=Stentor coeruleus TaxID=5963 RepID=A0A1R2AMP9_9CILI|nr:hypothetical protein SteCoe_37601 [Stentor coeruleus]
MQSVKSSSMILNQGRAINILGITASITIIIEILIVGFNINVVIFQSIACAVCFFTGLIGVKIGIYQTYQQVFYYPVIVLLCFSLWLVFTILSFLFQMSLYSSNNKEKIIICAVWTFVSVFGTGLLVRFFIDAVRLSNSMKQIEEKQEIPFLGVLLSENVSSEFDSIPTNAYNETKEKDYVQI